MNKKTLFLTSLIIIIVFSSSYFYLKLNKEKTNVTNSYILTFDSQKKGNLKKIKSGLNRLGIVNIKKEYNGIFPVIVIEATKDMANDVRDIEGVIAVDEKEVLKTRTDI